MRKHSFFYLQKKTLKRCKKPLTYSSEYDNIVMGEGMEKERKVQNGSIHIYRRIIEEWIQKF